MVEIAQEKKVVTGRKMRVDMTVVEDNIHYPTDNGLLSKSVSGRHGRSLARCSSIFSGFQDRNDRSLCLQFPLPAWRASSS